jgi:hypothetical protein
MNYDDLLKELESTFDEFVDETGAELEASTQQLAKTAGTLAKALAKSRGKKGFSIGLEAARDVLALEAGIEAVENADALDARLHGIFEAALRIGSKALTLI